MNISSLSSTTDAYAARIARLQCPLCQRPLTVNTQGMGCEKKHQFDRAKEGYFNLLPVQKKNSLEPGDAKEQLQARRDFLRAGYFDGLLTLVNKAIPSTATSLLDIGCGEGYFTAGIAHAHASLDVYGVDIAKSGVRLAAKQRDKSTIYAVASAFDLPFHNHSIDVITRIYAPSKDVELTRVLAPEGRLIIAAPGPHHLLGVRQRIYENVRDHEPPETPQGFRLVGVDRLEDELVIDVSSHIDALLAMTPFAWRLNAATKTALVSDRFRDKIDFTVSVFEKI